MSNQPKGRVMWFIPETGTLHAVDCDSISVADGVLALNFSDERREHSLDGISEIIVRPHGHPKN